MIVRVHSLADFRSVIEREPGVHRNLVHVSLDYTWMDDYHSRRAVAIHLSCVIRIDEQEDYLLHGGESCGRDVCDSTQEMEGTELGLKLIREFEMWCEARGLRTLPGVLDMR